MPKLNLYQLTVDLESTLDDLLILSDTDRDTALGDLNKLLIRKTDSTVSYRQQLQDKIKLAKERLDYIKSIKSSLESQLERLDDMILNCMQMTDSKELRGELHSIKIRKPSQVVLITDEDALTPCYKTVVQTVKVDKVALKKALSLGELIDGAELVDGKKSLNIR